MSDDNVVQLFQTAEGNLVKKENLPKPGSVDWARNVLRNVIRAASTDEERCSEIIGGIDHTNLLRLTALFSGNLIDMAITPLQEYHQRGKAISEEVVEDEELFKYIGDLVFDVLIFCGHSAEYARKFIASLTVGQFYTLYVTGFTVSCAEIIKTSELIGERD